MRLKSFYNHYLTKYYYYHRKIALTNKPRVFAFELTNYCNLDCAMCPRRFMKRKVGFMNFGLFKNIIKQIRGYNAWVFLHNFGEPLFHPQLEQIIDHCAENNIRTYLSTNATILDDKKSYALLNSKLDKIVLCLDGVTKEVYQKIRQGGDFDKTRNNILNFLTLKKKLRKDKPLAYVQIIRMNETDDEIEDCEKQWKNLADTVLIKRFSTWACQVDSITKMSKPEHLYFEKRNVRYPCLHLWKDGVVLWNGDFVPCCMDFDGKMVLGNLRNKNLKDIWNSAKIISMRKDQVENNYHNPLCKNCLEWSGQPEDISFPFSKILDRPWRHIINPGHSSRIRDE